MCCIGTDEDEAWQWNDPYLRTLKIKKTRGKSQWKRERVRVRERKARERERVRGRVIMWSWQDKVAVICMQKLVCYAHLVRKGSDELGD